MPYIADRRLYVTADMSRIVEEHDPEAAFLLCAKGDELSDADAEKYGLVPRETLNDEGDEPEVEPESDEPEMKERKASPKTKVKKPSQTKKSKG